MVSDTKPETKPFFPIVTVNHPVSIDNQNSLPKATWHFWSATYHQELPISEDNFVRMWKTLILRHLQEVSERQVQKRPDNPVPIYGNMPVPTPLADLLKALGSFDDHETGIRHRAVVPNSPADLSPDSWWKLDGQVVRDWVLTNTVMNQLSLGLVRFHSFDRQRVNFGNRPLMLTVRQCDDDMGNVTIRAKTKGPRPEDATVRANNDELFQEPYSVDDCSIVMCSVNAPCTRATSMARV